MKTPEVAIVAVVILMVAASVGFGIAQAGDTHTIGEFMEWQTPEASEGSQTAAAGSHTIGEFMEWQTRGPVETGAIPGAVFEESWMKDYGND